MYSNKYKIFIILLIITVIFSVFTVFVYSESNLNTSAKGAALYVPEIDEFLYTKNADERLAMASTTKIMTALIALEKLDHDKYITVDERSVGIEGSSIYLKPNEVIKVSDLIYATILQSANDAAAALAYEISGSIESFAEVMNERAKDLGLINTNFKNPHGLDDPEHYTSAHDLAIIAATALKNDTFKNISSTYKKEITTSETSRLLVNHNKMLKKYDGCIGVKTGYTKRSGRSLVTAAQRDDLTLVCVTINDPNDWIDHTKMLDYGYSILESVKLAEVGEFSYKIPVLDGSHNYITVSNDISAKVVLNNGNTNFETQVKLSPFVSAPIKQGDILGKVIFTKSGQLLSEIELKADFNVEYKKLKRKFSLKS